MRHRWCARFGAGLTLIVVAVPALASEWWYVNSGNGRVLLVDAQSIERRKDIVTYWTMYVIRPADPDSLPDRVENPERIKVLAPGEPFELRRLQN